MKGEEKIVIVSKGQLGFTYVLEALLQESVLIQKNFPNMQGRFQKSLFLKMQEL